LPLDIHTFALDLRGFGDSSYNERVMSLKDLAKDIKLFMESQNIKKANIVGWSLGGGVVMEFAAAYPDLTEKLILINSTTHKGYPVFKKNESGQPIIGQVYSTREEMAKDPIQVKPVLDALNNKNFDFMKYIFDITIYTYKKPNEEDNKLYIDETLKQRNLVDVDFALASQNMGQSHNLYSAGENTISYISCPVLHFWGTYDITVPESLVLDNVNALEDQSTYIKFDECGHSPLVDKPEELTASIIDFIK
jgi:pimeloyl-ACP methyl ester carboxylesterase